MRSTTTVLIHNGSRTYSSWIIIQNRHDARRNANLPTDDCIRIALALMWCGTIQGCITSHIIHCIHAIISHSLRSINPWCCCIVCLHLYSCRVAVVVIIIHVIHSELVLLILLHSLHNAVRRDMLTLMVHLVTIYLTVFVALSCFLCSHTEACTVAHFYYF